MKKVLRLKNNFIISFEIILESFKFIYFYFLNSLYIIKIK